MNNKIIFGLFLTTLLLGTAFGGSFNEIAGVMVYNLTHVSTQTHYWFLINTNNSPLPINITTPIINGIKITSSVSNTIIPSNSSIVINITASLIGTPQHTIQISTANAYITAYIILPGNYMAKIREGLSKELIIYTNVAAPVTTTTSIATTTIQGTNGPYGTGGVPAGSNTRPFTISNTLNCAVVSNFSQTQTWSPKVNGKTFFITENFISPTTAGVSVTQSPYTLSLNTVQNISTAYGYSLELMNISYIPIQHTVTVELCYNAPPATTTVKSPPPSPPPATTTTIKPSTSIAQQATTTIPVQPVKPKGFWAWLWNLLFGWIKK